MTAVDLGVPTVGTRRRRSRQVRIGGDAPVSVQSMTTTVTADIDATLRQIAELTAAGCQIVRVAVPNGFLPHASREEILRAHGLDSNGIAGTVLKRLARMKAVV